MLVVGPQTIFLEPAGASGLGKLSEAEWNPLKTTSYGTGEMIRWAVEAGYKDILIGIGGSATNDGGSGMLEALGARFTYDGDPCRAAARSKI